MRRLNHKIRTTKKYREWREAVKKRDKNTCLVCWRNNIPIEVDHIRPFINILVDNNIKTLRQAYSCKDLWDVGNGRVLCKEHHKKTPSYMQRYRRTK